MGMFSNLMGKLFAHATPATQPSGAGSSAPTPAAGLPAATPPPAPATEPIPAMVDAGAGSLPSATAPQSVDVATILDGLQGKSDEDLDWKKSIVDMLKLLGMDSGLTARKELATELGYTGDEHDSATMNVWLHKAVMQKVAANGGKVPAELMS